MIIPIYTEKGDLHSCGISQADVAYYDYFGKDH